MHVERQCAVTSTSCTGFEPRQLVQNKQHHIMEICREEHGFWGDAGCQGRTVAQHPQEHSSYTTQGVHGRTIMRETASCWIVRPYASASLRTG